jgi:hypothetical protein
VSNKLNERISEKLSEAKAAEAAVITSIILDNSLYDEVKTILGPDSFGHPANRIIYQAIQDTIENEEKGVIDGIILRDKLQENGKLKEVGGVEYLGKVLNSCPSAANCKYYAGIVKEQSSFRRLVEIYNDLGRELELDKPTIEIRTAFKQTIERIDGDIIEYDSMPEIVNLADVQAEPVRWLWPYHFPMGMPSNIQGHPGLGKSTLAHKIASIVTTGGAWPNCNNDPISKADKGRVLILDAENPIAQTIKPRLISMGADTSKIDILRSVIVRDDNGRRKGLFDLQRDITALRQAIRPDTRLLVIDPLSAFFPRNLDSNNNADVRSALLPLAELSEKSGCAIISISHLTKSDTGRAVHRGLGSIAFTAFSRAVWQVSDDPNNPKNGKRLLTVCKINICAEPPGLVFSIDNGGNLSFEGETDLSADECLQQGSTIAAPKREKAVQWLKDTLTGKSMLSSEIEHLAKENDVTAWMLKEAKKELGTISYPLTQPDGKPAWFMRLPE